MRLLRRATQRAASFSVALASVFLLATCDLDKITNVDTTKGAVLDSTDLTLSITGGTDITLGGTATVSVATTDADMTAAVTAAAKEYTSSDATTISVVKETGVMTGLKIGTAKITARVLAPELGAGVTRSQNVRVRYKGIKLITPVAGDSIQGLGQTRAVSIQGTNFSNALVVGALTADSLRVRAGGVLDTSMLRIAGTTLTAKRNGTSYIVAFFDGFRDSVAVRVRQVAKSITYPTTDYTARHVNFNLTVPLTVRDVADSIIPTPTLKWTSNDTTVATIGLNTGVLRLKKVDTTRIFAEMDTVKRGQKVLVSQVVGMLQKFAGDAQTDTVALPAAINPTVTALDSGSTIVAGASITFKTGLGLNAAITDSVKTTDALGRATLGSWKLGDVAGTSNNTVIATAASNATTTFTASAVPGAPYKLAFVVQPTSSPSSTAFSPAVKVQVLDSLDNPVLNATNSITITISYNPGGSSLAGTQVASAVAGTGTATFNGLEVDNGFGAGYTLEASAAGLTSAISNAFDVYGAPAQLAFISATPAPTATATIVPPVKVAVQDAQGITVANATNSVSLGFTGGPGGATLTGSGVGGTAAVNGVATFSDLKFSAAGTGYVLQASSAGLTTGNSASFNVVGVGAPSKLAFSVQPSNVVAGASIAPQIQVQVLDANGALVTTATTQVTLSIEATSPTGGTLSGTLAQVASGGVASFNNISINKAAVGFKLLATATSVTSATSTAFNVTTGTASKIGFVQQPTHTVLNTPIAPAVTVEVQDASGNRVTTGGPFSVTMTVQSGTCTGATLSGGTAQPTTAGVATFSALSLSAAVNNCALTAASTGGLGTVNSSTFNSVIATGASRLAFTTEPSASAGAGTVLATSPVVAIKDASGNNVSAPSTVTINLSVLSGPQSGFTTGGGNLNTTTTATFTNIRFNKAGTYKLLATASGYRPDTTADIVIDPGTVNGLAMVTQPANTVAGVPFAQPVQVGVVDQYGNVVPGTTNTIEITYYKNTGSATPLLLNTGTSQVTKAAVNGIATFTGLAARTAGVGMYLVPRSTGINETSSSLFTVSPAPLAKLGFAVQPPSGDTVALPLTAIQVAGQDSVGNTVSDFTNAVTVAMTGGTAGAVLSGTKTVAPTAGVSTFSDLSIDRVGSGYQLSGSASGVTTGTSTLFNIDPYYLTANSGGGFEQHVLVGGTVYFVGGSALKSVPVGGGLISTVAGSTNAYRITTDGTDVYWTERGVNNNGDAFVKKLTVSSGIVSTLTDAQSSLAFAGENRIYSDGVNVYFTARNGPTNGIAIRSVPVNAVGATPTDLFPNTNNFTTPFFTLGGLDVYFYDPSDASVRRIPHNGGAITTLASGVTAQHLTLDGTTLYYSQGVDIYSIANAPSIGGPVTPTLVATGTGTVYGLVAHNGFLYAQYDQLIRRYPTANFATYSDLAFSANGWHYGLQFDSTRLFYWQFGRLAKVPK